jgi:twitching motility protein PilT
MRISDLCLQMEKLEASDLFLSVGRRPSMRKAGVISVIPGEEVLQLQTVQDFFRDCLPAGTWERLERERDVDLGVSLEDAGRFRLNLSWQRGQIALAIRRVPSGRLEFSELGIPDIVARLAEQPRGLLLVTGATGSGKTTTLAAIVNHINQTMPRHIITIEDPIEFMHEDNKALVSQREIGGDTRDFATALKHVVRQNPDVIIIGEMRDQETIATAISAALTGHLVAATIHTVDVQQTLERILNYFPDGQREQVAMDFALALQGIISQRLLPTKSGQHRVPAFEIFVATALGRRLIANRDLDSIPELIKNGFHDGMQTFNRSLIELYSKGLVELEIAAGAASNRDEFLLLSQGMETGVDTFRGYSGDADQGLSIKKLLRNAVRYGASDLLLTVDSPPVIRLDGNLRPFDMPVLSGADTQKLLFSILAPRQRADFEENREIDFALSVKGIENAEDETEYRFRVNGFYQRGRVAAAFRVIPMNIPSPAALRLPPAILNLATLQQGLVLVTGPTGHGKSTTLAALISEINRTRPCHVITIEDPIEFVHPHKMALIEQREVNADTLSFQNALKYVLRQAPDVILIGEMRDPETIAAALTAAETGHLVFATLHTNDVTQSVDRIIDVFPADQQTQVRSQLAASLSAIISQRLLPLKSEKGGRVAAFEILLGTIAVKAMIRDKKTHQLKALMETAAREGMITMERALKNLFEEGLISRATYQLAARTPDEY